MDDMVQDVVDVMTWVHHSSHVYHADKVRSPFMIINFKA